MSYAPAAMDATDQGGPSPPSRMRALQRMMSRQSASWTYQGESMSADRPESDRQDLYRDVLMGIEEIGLKRVEDRLAPLIAKVEELNERIALLEAEDRQDRST